MNINNEKFRFGKTKTKTIQGRMYDHLKHKHGDTDSDLANMVLKRPYLPQDYLNYSVRYLPLEDSRDRMIFEMFTISILDPKLNKDDNKPPIKKPMTDAKRAMVFTSAPISVFENPKSK
mgnify:CR=1 FL=1